MKVNTSEVRSVDYLILATIWLTTLNSNMSIAVGLCHIFGTVVFFVCAMVLAWKFEAKQ